MAKTISIELDDVAEAALASVRGNVAEHWMVEPVSEAEAIKAALEAIDSMIGPADVLPARPQ